MSGTGAELTPDCSVLVMKTRLGELTRTPPLPAESANSYACLSPNPYLLAGVKPLVPRCNQSRFAGCRAFRCRGWGRGRRGGSEHALIARRR